MLHSFAFMHIKLLIELFMSKDSWTLNKTRKEMLQILIVTLVSFMVKAFGFELPIYDELD